MTLFEQRRLALLERTVTSLTKAVEALAHVADSGSELSEVLIRDLKVANERIDALEAASEAGEACRRAARPRLQ